MDMKRCEKHSKRTNQLCTKTRGQKIQTVFYENLRTH